MPATRIGGGGRRARKEDPWPSIAAEQARLVKAEVKFEGPVDKPYGMREVSFDDPDGYCWTLGEKVRA